MDYQLKDIETLQKLRQERWLRSSIRRIKVTPNDSLQAKRIEKKLNRYYFACGCEEGSLAVFLTMSILFLIWWSRGFVSFIRWWKLAAIIAAAALAGKLIGLAVNRYRLKKMFRVLEAYYTRDSIA